MIAKLLYLAGIVLLVADTQYWGLSTAGLMMIWIAAAADAEKG